MKSYTEGRNLYGVLTKNTSTANLSLGDQIANDDYRAICAAKDWPFLQRDRTLTTLASTQSYNLPHDCDQVKAVSVIVSNETYVAEMAPDKDTWDRINETSYTSDYPEWYYVEDDKIYLWPTPTSAGNTISITQKTRVIDLSITDISETIVTATNGSKEIEGDGGVNWNSSLVGMWLRIDYSTDPNKGDGLWYEIAEVVDNTNLKLNRAYGGTSIAAGSASYTIGQMPLLPEAYQDLPWLYAAGVYWEKEADARGAAFMAKHGNFGQGGGLPTGRIADLVKNYSSVNTSMVIDNGDDNKGYINPNLTINI